jgi:type I restriction enzyme M protein
LLGESWRDGARQTIAPFFKGRGFEGFIEFDQPTAKLRDDTGAFVKAVNKIKKLWGPSKRENAALKSSAGKLGELAERGHNLARQIDYVAKLFARLVDSAEKELDARDDEQWESRDVRAAAKELEGRRADAAAQLNLIRYFVRHAHWLQNRFPNAKLCDVEGLVKVVSFKELEANDWSVTPGRYVGVAPEEEDEDFDFDTTLREIHVELADLNEEAVQLAGKISKNFEALGI